VQPDLVGTAFRMFRSADATKRVVSYLGSIQSARWRCIEKHVRLSTSTLGSVSSTLIVLKNSCKGFASENFNYKRFVVEQQVVCVIRTRQLLSTFSVHIVLLYLEADANQDMVFDSLI
jgi:hypothetical protein